MDRVDLLVSDFKKNRNLSGFQRAIVVNDTTNWGSAYEIFPLIETKVDEIRIKSVYVLMLEYSLP